ncbi:sugar ABC transporter substrate-binding protein [Inquilinus sp. OTU3971]|uniref:sugar ABC transporter substrate-binding protein n=1 Tax=Inquilinus sp. OTU3971 TaxID=3043855 RepID=UPI00313C210F
MIRTWWTKALCCAAVLAPLSAVDAPARAAEGRTLTIGIIELFSGEFFTEARKGYEEAAKQDNLELLVENGDGDVATEAKLIDIFITRHVDAILVSVQSPTGSMAALRRAKEANIAVVCYDTCVNPPDDKALVKAFVTSDNRGLGATTGKQVADYVRARLGGKARLLLLTCETFDVCKARRQGFDEALAGLDVEVLDAQEGFQTDKARPLADAMLTAHPDADLFMAFNDGAAIAAGQAVGEAGLAGKMPVFAIDVNPQVAALIADAGSAVVWTTGQDPYSMGRIGVEFAARAARGVTISDKDFYQFTPSPTYSKSDPKAVEDYIKAH